MFSMQDIKLKMVLSKVNSNAKKKRAIMPSSEPPQFLAAKASKLNGIAHR
jgi:hypothetical protein